MTIINNAMTGTFAARAALEAASQNVANVATPGYSRLGVLLSSVASGRVGALSGGDGVNVSALLRFSDTFKSLQLWRAHANLGQRETTQAYLNRLEQVMGDEVSGVNAGLDAFYAALNAASVEPTSNPLRQQVVIVADALATRFNNLQQTLAGQRLGIFQQRAEVVGQINALVADIAKLNQKITLARATGSDPSALSDQRDLQIDKLAFFVDVQVVDQPDGTRNVSLRGGQPLVAGALAATMTVAMDNAGAQQLVLQFAKESFRVVDGRIGGQLGGLDDFEHRILEPMVQAIYDLAAQLGSNVNRQLEAGFKMDGSPGVPLFQFNPGSASAMLAVTPGMLGSDLAFSSHPAQPGNSDNLIALIETRKQAIQVTGLGSVLVGDVYTQLVAKLGIDSQQNQTDLKTAQTVRGQAETSWRETSGVSLDEEAIALQQYQQMYTANMKVIAVANQVVDATLAMLN